MTTTKTRSTYDPAESPLKIPPTGTPGRDEHMLDQAIAESFPASDPISPAYESSLEPVLLENNRKRDLWKRRLRKATPSLLALGGAAVLALVAVYVMRDRRISLSDVRDSLGDSLGDLRDRLPWRS